MIVMTSSAGALLMACGTDLTLERSMIKGVGHILQMRQVSGRPSTLSAAASHSTGRLVIKSLPRNFAENSGYIRNSGAVIILKLVWNTPFASMQPILVGPVFLVSYEGADAAVRV